MPLPMGPMAGNPFPVSGKENPTRGDGAESIRFHGEGRIFQNVSSGRIETFRSCARKWWFEKVAALKRPKDHVFLVGDRLHAQAEAFHRGEPILQPGFDEGLDADESRWLLEMVQKACSAGVWCLEDGLEVELPLCFLVGEHLTRYGMPLVCRAETEMVDQDGDQIRVVRKPEHLLDGTPVPEDAFDLPFFTGFLDIYRALNAFKGPKIMDHKTSKNRRYGKRAKGIPFATQLRIYACLPFAMHPGLDRIEAGYNVFIKDVLEPDPVYQVTNHITRATAQEEWAQVVKDVRQMKDLAVRFPRIGGRKDPERAANYSQVPATLDPRSCDQFGGCFYKDLCQGRCSYQQMTVRFDTGQVGRDKPKQKSKPLMIPFGKGK